MAAFHGYSVVRPIACGGGGEVWLVRHELLQTDFAVKVVPRAVLDGDAELRRQFSVEARIAGKVRHPALVSVYDAGLDESTGLYFLVMDFMPGGSVAEKLSTARKFSVRKAASIVRTVASGLVELKRLGMVHRDVKPQNMLIAANGDVKLADFGIALSLGSRHGRSAERDDVAIGTPLYMSYEQIADSDAIDFRADVYSLGVSFFEMLAGTCPGSELSTDELLRTRLEGARLPDIRTLNAAIPENVAQLIYRMTDPDVATRTEGPEAVVEEIDAMLGDSKKPEAPGGGKKAAVLSAAAVVALLIAFYVLLKLPSWMADAGDDDLPDHPPRPEMGELAYVPDGTEAAPEPQTSIVTQVVEYTREVVKTVVVTAAEDIVKSDVAQNSGGAAEVPAEPPLSAGPARPIPEPPCRTIGETVCGIKIECDPDMTNALKRLSECISVGDAEVRKFMVFGRGDRVQSAVDEIRIVKPDIGAKGWRRNGKTLAVSLDAVSDDEKLEDLVSSFMTSRRDRRAVEPFANELYWYIKNRVQDCIATARGRTFTVGVTKARIQSAIDFCRATKRKYGRNDYDGRFYRYGSSRQVVPQGAVARNREGKIFMIMRIAESIEKSAILRYFTKKEKAIADGLIDRRMSANDFAALLSIAVGQDLFPILANEGWHVDRFAANVKMPRLPRAVSFEE